MQERPSYRAYLVRLWPTERDGAADYRVSVQCAATGERRDFADLAALLAYWRDLRISPQPPRTDIDSSTRTITT